MRKLLRQLADTLLRLIMEASAFGFLGYLFVVKNGGFKVAFFAVKFSCIVTSLNVLTGEIGQLFACIR